MDDTYYVMLGIDDYSDLRDRVNMCEICGSVRTEKPHIVGKVSRCRSSGTARMHIMFVCAVCSSTLSYKNCNSRQGIPTSEL